MYDTYTQRLYELFRDSSLFRDLSSVVSYWQQLIPKIDSIIQILEKLLIVGVFGLGLYLVFKLLMKGWTRL